MTSCPTLIACESPSRRARESRRGRPDDREIRIRILADELGRERSPVGERDVDALRVVHDVAVGENQAVRRDDKARALAAVSAAIAAASQLDRDDRWANLLDRADDGLRICV